MTDAAVAVVTDPPEPEALFARLAHLPYAAWFDTAATPTGRPGRTFVAWDPFAVLESRGGDVTWATPRGRIPVHAPVLEALAAALTHGWLLCGGLATGLAWRVIGGGHRACVVFRNDRDDPIARRLVVRLRLPVPESGPFA